MINYIYPRLRNVRALQPPFPIEQLESSFSLSEWTFGRAKFPTLISLQLAPVSEEDPECWLVLFAQVYRILL